MQESQNTSTTTLAGVPVLILAGGRGTRLGEIAKDNPKSMIEVGGKPFIAHQLDLLKREGASEAILLLGHMSDKIEQFVGNGERFGVKVRYSHDTDRALGTGGAVKAALTNLKDLPDEIAIMYGDTYLDIPMAPVFAQFKTSGRKGLMTVWEANPYNQPQWKERNTAFNRSTGLIEKYDKKKATESMHHFDFGLSFFKRSVFGKPSKKTSFDIGDVFQSLIKESQLAGFEVDRRFYDLNTPESLIETRAYLGQNQLWQLGSETEE
ncbi:MAG: NTP transferase domain-containing protein [Candidatus Obscuribacterales bacterium]|nr:NTP transferase domain-containing protein [Candidatus Obscuribacterales bacterium]